MIARMPTTLPNPDAMPEIPAELRTTAEADWARPVCHFHPPAGWMNDPNGTIHHQGWHHLFYQLCPASAVEGPKSWGHARSRDLVDWQHLPIALAPDAAAGEEGVWSGGAALADDGTPLLVYTSRPHPDAAGRSRFRQVAVACDAELRTFTRLPGPLLASDADPACRDDARDPFLFCAEGRTWMVHGAVRAGRSVVLLHEAVDGSLRRWRSRGELLSWPTALVPFPECPNLLPVGDRWLLLLSPYGPVEGFLGTFRNGHFTVEREVRLDHHDAFYATNTLTDPSGATIVVAWIRGWPVGRSWNGCLAAPRVVHADARSGIRQAILPAWLEALADGPAQTWAGAIPGEGIILDAEAGDQLDIRVVWRRAPGGSVALLCGEAENGAAFTIAWRGDRLHVCGHAVVVPESLTELDLHLVVDRALIEVFADQGRTVVSRVHLRTQRGAVLRQVAAGNAVAAEVSWRRLRAARFTA